MEGDILQIDQEFLIWGKKLKEKDRIGKKKSNKEFGNLHGKYVCGKIIDLEEFIKSWRQLFIDKLKP